MSREYWHDLKAPTRATDVSTRLVSATGFAEGVKAFWAMTPDGHKGLLAVHPSDQTPATFPSFKKIKIHEGRYPGTDTSFVLIELLDEKTIEPFAKLCEDIVDALSKALAKDAKEHIRVRLEIWKHLLKSDNQELSKEEQKGLFAELVFLERVVLEALDPLNAVRSWTGPLRSPRDYSFGKTFAEVKSNRGSLNPSVKISSEHQLSPNSDELLYLYVLGLNEGQTGGASLARKVSDLRSRFQMDYLAAEEFDLRLTSAGYSDDYDYSLLKWEETFEAYYVVDESFPCIRSSDLPAGVSKVSYEVNLGCCGGCAVSYADVLAAIGGDDVD